LLCHRRICTSTIHGGGFKPSFVHSPFELPITHLILGPVHEQCSRECACVRRMWDGRRESVVDADPAVFCPDLQQRTRRSREQGPSAPPHWHRMARGHRRGSQVDCARKPWRRIQLSAL
jgi:hypothetical protein